MRSFLSIVTAPALCLGLLGGLALENRRHTRPEDADPYHTQAAETVKNWPERFGSWVGSEQNKRIPAAAQNLLRPNAMQYHIYTRTGGVRTGVPVYMEMLLVQCRMPTDMSGHYPLNCYPNNGQPLVGQPIPRTWNVPGVPWPVRGVEYHFQVTPDGTNTQDVRPRVAVVYDFFILPGRGICPDMADVREATGDYQFKHYGATQIQVKFDSRDGTQAGRDEAFIELLTANAERLRKLGFFVDTGNFAM